VTGESAGREQPRNNPEIAGANEIISSAKQMAYEPREVPTI